MQALPIYETIPLFIVILGVLVLVHEFGHFVTAKLFGVEAPEFGIGFPPRLLTLWRTAGWIELQNKIIRIPRDFQLPENLAVGSQVAYKTRAENGREILTGIDIVDNESQGYTLVSRVQKLDRGTIFTLNALPIGGFVRLNGEDDATVPNALAARPPWQRAIVLVAGVTMNVVLAVVAFFVFEAAFPRPVLGTTTQVVGLPANSPAAQAGVRVGDVIVAVNGVNVKNNRTAMLAQIQPYCGREVKLDVERLDPKGGAQILSLNLTPQPSGNLPCAVGVVINQQVGERIASVEPNSLGAQIGLKAGDGLASVGDFNLVTFPGGSQVQMQSAEELATYIKAHSKVRTTLLVQVVRDGLPLSPMRLAIPENVSDAQAMLGLKLSAYASFGEAAQEAWNQMGMAVSMVPRTFINMFANMARGADSGVGGPIRIAQLVAEGTPSGGMPFVVYIFAALSLNLAILNILPFPGLDGGRLAFVLLEVLRGGRKLDPRIEGVVHLVGIMILLAFILFVSYNDVARLLAGKSAFAP